MITIARQGVRTLIIFSMIAWMMPIHAASKTTWYKGKKWRPVVAVGFGAAISSNLGESQNLPVLNPVTDEMYNYSANNTNQTSFLLNAFLGAEWKLWKKWLVEAGLSYYQPAVFSAKGTFLQGPDALSANTYNYQYNISSKQLLVESKFLYTYKKRFHPYFLVGLGAAFNKAYNYSTNVPSFLTFTRNYANHTQTSFSYKLGIGIDTDIARHFRLGIGYRFADLGKVALGNATIDNVGACGTLSQSNLYTNEILGQLIWVFN